MGLELLWSLRPLRYVLHFPDHQANAAVGGKMCIHAEHRQSTHTHIHNPCWVWKQDPRGSAVSFWSTDDAEHQQEVRAPKGVPDGRC